MTRDPLIGTEVGRYRITHEIGEGGMGRVYEAIRAESGAVVAIKVLSDRYAQDASLVERFFAEARAANLVAHEGIVKVHDLATLPDGRPYIVMERLVGTSLRRLLDEDPPPLGGVLQMMLEVLSALGAAHEAGIVHRDLKPDNIFVTTKGRVKLLDFGVAKLTGAHAIARTQTGVVLGTPEYMAPEHITDGVCDARSDVYAAGVVLFEALAGRRPFDGTTDFELMRAHVSREPPRVRSLRPALPQGLDDIIHRALSKRPAERFSSARSMANALHHVSAKISLEDWKPIVPGGRLMSPRPPNEPPPLEPSDGHRAPTMATVAQRPRRSPPPRRRRWPVVVGALVLTGAIGAVLAIEIGGSGEVAPEPVPVASAPLVVASPVPIVITPDAPLVVVTEEDPPRAPRARRTEAQAGPVVPARATEARTPVSTKAIDAGNFDVLGFFPEAHALARARAADAGFIGLEVSRVRPGGRVVLGRVVYRFGAKSLPADTCEIRITVTARGTTVTHQLNKCGQPILVPRCTPAQIRQKARVLREATSMREADLTYDGSGWSVFTGKDRETLHTIPDGCAPSSWASSVADVDGERFEIERALTSTEKTQRDFKQLLAETRTFAQELEPGSKLVKIGVVWSRGKWTVLGASYIGSGRCVHVRADARSMMAERPSSCERRSPVPPPRCTPDQITAMARGRVEGISSLELVGDEWIVTGENIALHLEDDC